MYCQTSYNAYIERELSGEPQEPWHQRGRRKEQSTREAVRLLDVAGMRPKEVALSEAEQTAREDEYLRGKGV